MRTATSVTKDEVVPYEDVPWRRVVGGEPPLDVILGRQMDAYIKVDLSKYAVCITRASSRTVMGPDGRQAFEEAQPEAGLPDVTILLLRLTEAQLDEIRSTGVCSIGVFTRGGLSRRPKSRLQLGSLRTPSERDAEREAALFTPLDFTECVLVEKSQATKRASRRSQWIPAPHEELRARMVVRARNLFLTKSDVYALRREGLTRWTSAPYPLEQEGLPIPIFWAFQASIAANREFAPMPAGVLGWLYENAPSEAYCIRGIKTLSSMVSFGYRAKHKFDDISLEHYPIANKLPAAYISKPIRLLMDIVNYWQVGLRRWDDARFQLWLQLHAAGFDPTACRNLHGLISGTHPTRRELEYFDWKLQRGGQDPQLDAVRIKSFILESGRPR